MFSTLTAVQELFFECTVDKVEVAVCDSLSCLRNLHTLDITLESSSLLILHTRWHLMKELCLLSWGVGFFQFGVHIMGLTELRFLQEPAFFEGTSSAVHG